MQKEQVQRYNKQSGKNDLGGEKERPLKGTAQLVRAYVIGFAPDLIVGLERDGLWYLPGGIVEGEGTPPGFVQGEHFGPLAHHIHNQTGLVLTHLSDAISVVMHPYEGGVDFDVTILYVAGAEGDLTRGTRLDPQNLPEFAPNCGEPADAITQFVCRGCI